MAVLISAACLCGVFECWPVALLSTAHAQDGKPVPDPMRATRIGYVGDSACLPCHKQQAISYSQTAHHLTSQLPDNNSILGSFKEGENILMIANPSTIDDPRLFFKMEKTPDGYRQSAIAERGQKKLTHSERIDLVFGSGVRGQTYLYWSGNQLFELPVSYWSDGHQWINSPGYEDGTANFNRHVDPRCVECHATYVRPLSTDPQTNVFEKDSLISGISCESCHGPGADHLAQETSRSTRPAKPANSSILNPAKFVRDRQVDQCALCHNGTDRKELAPAFSYLPGRILDQYLGPNPVYVADRQDVHGNQVGLLKKSLCYLASPSMSCSTCHDVHEPERAAADHSDRCLTCHQWQSCGASRTLGIKIKQNCIDCHMPLQQTNAIVSVTAGKVLRTSIRTHWIKIYPAKAQEFIER